MGTVVLHLLVFLLFHTFCIATDAPGVAAAGAAIFLERRKYFSFLLCSLANTVFYVEGIIAGVQAHRSAMVLFDSSCRTPQAEMPSIDWDIFEKWEESQAETVLFVMAASAPFFILAFLSLTISRDLPINQLSIVQSLEAFHIL